MQYFFGLVLISLQKVRGSVAILSSLRHQPEICMNIDTINISHSFAVFTILVPNSISIKWSVEIQMVI